MYQPKQLHVLRVKRLLALLSAGVAVGCGYRVARPGDLPKGQEIRVAMFENYTAQVEAGGVFAGALREELEARGRLGADIGGGVLSSVVKLTMIVVLPPPGRSPWQSSLLAVGPSHVQPLEPLAAETKEPYRGVFVGRVARSHAYADSPLIVERLREVGAGFQEEVAGHEDVGAIRKFQGMALAPRGGPDQRDGLAKKCQHSLR